MDEYLSGAIKASSQIYDLVQETPLIHAPILSKNLEQNVYLKREDLQQIFSFKIRGSYNRILQLTPEELSRGVVTCSAGNHGQGVALASEKVGTSAIIVVPENSPQIKVERMRNLGGDVILHGKDYDEAFQKCLEISEESGRVIIHPFDDPYVIHGNGTIGLEIIRQMGGNSIDYVFVCIGGGGLISGILSVLKHVSAETKVIGVESEGANSMSQSLKKGEIVTLEQVDTFIDGKAINKVGEHGFKICQKHLDEVILVTNKEVCQAIKMMYNERRIVLEPAGAVSIAGMMKYLSENHIGLNRNLICVLSGANMDFDLLSEVINIAKTE